MIPRTHDYPQFYHSVSWERGEYFYPIDSVVVGAEFRLSPATAVEAELEYHHPSFSPFSAADTSALLDIPPVLLSLAKQIIADKPTAESFPRGKGLILVEDDAAGDPASLGTHCLTVLNYLARKQKQGTSDGAEQEFVDKLRKAIDGEMLFLLEHAPKVCCLGDSSDYGH